MSSTEQEATDRRQTRYLILRSTGDPLHWEIVGAREASGAQQARRRYLAESIEDTTVTTVAVPESSFQPYRAVTKVTVSEEEVVLNLDGLGFDDDPDETSPLTDEDTTEVRTFDPDTVKATLPTLPADLAFGQVDSPVAS